MSDAHSVLYDPVEGQGQGRVTLKVEIKHKELTFSPAWG